MTVHSVQRHNLSSIPNMDNIVISHGAVALKRINTTLCKVLVDDNR